MLILRIARFFREAEVSEQESGSWAMKLIECQFLNMCEK